MESEGVRMVANELAKLGYTAAQIISHYYNGAVLSSVEK